MVYLVGAIEDITGDGKSSSQILGSFSPYPPRVFPEYRRVWRVSPVVMPGSRRLRASCNVRQHQYLSEPAGPKRNGE
eukprot:scaffold7863_cov37-Cyclotella_meneghiniana.AAC.5